MIEDFRLFTSLRRDYILDKITQDIPAHAGWNHEHRSPLYMLDFHRDRMLKAAVHWKWSAAIDVLEGSAGLQRLVEIVEKTIVGKQSAYRVKIILSREGQLSCEAGVVPSVPLSNLFPVRLPPPDAGIQEGDPMKELVYDVLPDTALTDSSDFTHFKTTQRCMYDDARGRAGLQFTDLVEVLLVNKDRNTIMEGSLTTPWFWRNGRWVTPPVSQDPGMPSGSGGQDGTTRRWALERGLGEEEIVSADSLLHGEQCWISNGVRGFVCGRVKLTT